MKWLILIIVGLVMINTATALNYVMCNNNNLTTNFNVKKYCLNSYPIDENGNNITISSRSIVLSNGSSIDLINYISTIDINQNRITLNTIDNNDIILDFYQVTSITSPLQSYNNLRFNYRIYQFRNLAIFSVYVNKNNVQSSLNKIYVNITYPNSLRVIPNNPITIYERGAKNNALIILGAK